MHALKIRPITALKIIAGILIAASFLVVTSNRADPDLGIHLAVGKWMGEHHSIERVDVHTYTMRGVEWVDHEWLLNLWLYSMHSRGLWWLVILIFAFLAAFPLFVWMRRARSFLELLPVIFTAIPLIGFIGIRFQLISFFFFFLLLEILIRADSGEKIQKRVWRLATLPLLFFIWANLHAGVAAGVLLFGTFVAARFGEEWYRKRRIENRALWFCLAVFIVSFFATLMNAFGWGLYEEILRVAASPYVATFIMEWRPALSFDRIPAPLFVAIFMFLAVLYRKKYPLALLVGAILFFTLFLRSVRMGPLFFLAAMPVIVRGAGYFNEEARAAMRLLPPRHVFWLKTTMVGLYLSVLLFLGYAVVTQKNESALLPEKALDFLVIESGEGRVMNVLNDYAWGGYMMWRAPSVRLFIDGRLPHVVNREGDSAMEDYAKFFYSRRERDWQEVLVRRNIDTVFIQNAKTAAEMELQRHLIIRPIVEYLQGVEFVKYFVRLFEDKLMNNTLGKKDVRRKLLEAGWRVVYEDTIAVVLTCRPDACPGKEP